MPTIVPMIQPKVQAKEIRVLSENTEIITKEVVIENKINATGEAVGGIDTTLSKLDKSDVEIEEIVEALNSYPIEVIDNISNDEIIMLERITEAEATAGNIKDKMNIVSVILNRVLSEDFPNTIYGVIFQESDGHYQFSPILDKRYWKVEISKDTIKAVKKVLKNGDSTDGALYFMNPQDVENKSTLSWINNLEFIFTDDIGHHFYR
jgi:spore germination cell wall hydrolase CwlJ-like protein